MWPWEPKPTELDTLDCWFYEGAHLFTALYRFYKTSFWGVGIHIGPNHPIYPKGFLTNFFNLPNHLQEKILDKVWRNGEGFNEIVIYKGYPRLRVDLRFLFLIYNQYKTENFPINKFGYGCWNGSLFSRTEARFTYGPYDPCASVNIPDFMESSNQNNLAIDFTKLCLNGRRRSMRLYS